jgi:flagellar biosynthesis anti-sigma factor FlgM
MRWPVSNRRAARKIRRKIKVFLTIADHSIAGNIARGMGMTIDLKRLLKKSQKRISGGLNVAPTSAKTTLVGGLGSPARDDKGKALSGTPFDRLRASSEDASVQDTRWDLFFSSLLNPTAIPGLDRSASAVAGSKTQDMPERSLADVEDVTHLFTWSAAVQTLKAQLDKVPEIRQQRVDSLKQAMAEGRYQMHPQQIAAAMLADGGFNLR